MSLTRYRNDGGVRKPSIPHLPTSFPKQILTPSRFKLILLINNGIDWKDYDSCSFWAENFGRSLEGQERPTRGSKVFNTIIRMEARCPHGPVGIAALLCRGQTAGGGSIPRWSASKPQVTRRKPVGAVQKKKSFEWKPTTARKPTNSATARNTSSNHLRLQKAEGLLSAANNQATRRNEIIRG